MNSIAYLQAVLRGDYLAFLQKAFHELCPADEFQPGWHLNAIGWQLERISAGDTRRLIITMPPRHLKSIAVSIAWVAYTLGKHPETRFICLSYNTELSAKFSRDFRQVMQSDWYQWLFPNTVLCRSTEMELETTAGGGRFATSVGGTLTGRGADIIIIDDPMKADAATSEVERRSVLDWTTSTLFSRLNDKQRGAIVVVMQRLHEEDLAGHLLASGSWEHLSLPAIAEEEQLVPIGPGRIHHRQPDDALHPEREPLETLTQLRRELGPYVFSAQYQQAPVPAGGTLIQRSWLRRQETPPARRSGDLVVQSWDTASKDGALNDYSVCVTALVRENHIYVLDVFRRQLNFPDLLRQVQMQAERHSPDLLLVEDAASGQQLIQVLLNSPIPGVPLPIACKPVSDKLTRMSAGCAIIEAGGLVLPVDGPWLAEFERELLGFPNGKRDDQVDALSQLISWFRDRPTIVRCMPWISDPDEDFPEYEQEHWADRLM